MNNPTKHRLTTLALIGAWAVIAAGGVGLAIVVAELLSAWARNSPYAWGIG